MATIESGNWLGLEPNLVYTPYPSYSTSRSPTEKRPKPQGIELLFSGTSVSNEKETLFVGRYGGIWGPPPESPIYWFGMAARGNAYQPTLGDWVTPLLSKVKNQKVNLAQFVAEFPSTSRMFKDFASRVIAVRSAIKRGVPFEILAALSGSPQLRGARIHMVRRTDRKRGRRAVTTFSWVDSQRGKVGTSALIVPTRVLASNELAFTYGVKPLLSDMKGALSEVISGVRSRPMIFSVTSTVSALSADSGIIKNDAYVIEADSLYEWSISMRRYTKLWIEMDKPTWVNDASRLGFMNLAALGWELIPYSFVVDWFLNIGSTLQNLDALYGVRRIGGSTTVTVESRHYTQCVPTNGGIGGSYARKLVAKSRSPVASLPSPAIRWEPYLSFNRILSGLALARTAFR